VLGWLEQGRLEHSTASSTMLMQGVQPAERSLGMRSTYGLADSKRNSTPTPGPWQVQLDLPLLHLLHVSWFWLQLFLRPER